MNSTFSIIEYQAFSKEDLKEIFKEKAEGFYKELEDFAKNNENLLGFKNKNSLKAKNYVGIIHPNLETCSDYEQALKYKFHLSYMLGEVLIQTFQNLHKGSMFKLAKNIKKANKEFKIFKEIFNNFAKLSPNIIKIISKNKQAFLKELPRIQNVLKIHQDYQPILDNIFHNFNYFIQKFNLIEEWLLSNDFNEKYKKENHPYPSLLLTKEVV